MSIKFPILLHWSAMFPSPVLDIYSSKYVKIAQFLQSSISQGMFPLICCYYNHT